MKKVIVIVGARPQFIKHVVLENAAKDKLNLITIHTGQHYDENMSRIFFDELGIAKPKYLLSCKKGNHGVQTAQMMEVIEPILEEESPDFVVVYGDTNSTLAGAIVASKLQIPIAHIEAGLRSYNRTMPEELNRVLTDHAADLLLVPSKEAKVNLAKEGIGKNVIEVGDVMKDLLKLSIDQNRIRNIDSEVDYYYATIHRPYNTDHSDRLVYIMKSLNETDKKVIFSLHPRTAKEMKKNNLNQSDYSNIEFISPQGYFDNLSYLFHSSGLITDSGGMQKEAYWLRKICVTVRPETEWLETLSDNANILAFKDLTNIDKFMNQSAKWNDKLYGNGTTGIEIVNAIMDYTNY